MLAGSGLAATHISEFSDGWSIKPEAAGIGALEYAHKAIELDEHYSYACLAACYTQLGRIDEAKKIANECVEHSGECALSSEEWYKFWRSQLKFKEQAPIDHLIEGLEKAGLVNL